MIGREPYIEVSQVYVRLRTNGVYHEGATIPGPSESGSLGTMPMKPFTAVLAVLNGHNLALYVRGRTDWLTEDR